MDFSALKKNRTSQLESLTAELNKLNTKAQDKSADDRFWYPAVDKAGNGYAVIRFLPAPEGEDVPFIRIWDHGFKGPGGWYIENSLTTIGEKDPVGELNSKLWNASEDDNSPERKQARAQKRRLTYISNIIVLKDPANPENEGKVFLYKYGKKIFDKLQEAMNPQFDDEAPMNPFDLWGGANFKLKIRQVEGYRNYDKSEFDAPSALLDDDAKLEKIWRKEHPLQPFLDRSNFKSFDDLKAKLHKVLGLDEFDAPAPRAAKVENTQYKKDEPTWSSKSEDEDLPWASSKPAAKAKAPADDDDESLEFFKSLADD